MLKISEEQLEAIEAARDEALRQSLFALARESFTECVLHLDDDALRCRIQEDLAAARGLGIRSPQALTEFVGLSLMGGEVRFYLQPEARDHLLGRGADPEYQVHQILLDVQRIAREEMEP